MDELLNSSWKFHLGDEPEAFYKGFDDSSWETVNLPHDWSVHGEFSRENSSGTGYLPGGTGWYRKSFTLSDLNENTCVYITFGGVYKNSRVWINSNYLGKRPYGYSTFTYDITEYAVNGENTLAVCAEHNETADSRWFTGNGIYRDVTLSVVNKTHFKKRGDGLFTYTEKSSPESAVVAANFSLTNEAEVTFTLLDGNNTEITAEKLTAKDGTVKLTVEKPHLWSDSEPYLYTLRCVAEKDGVPLDEINEKIGIRSFVFSAEKGFFINGVNKKLNGVCVHHDSGALGAAMHKCVWKKRLLTLKDMGCNAIRTSHNPPDKILLDLCDELGFFVMDEAFDEWDGCKNKWWHGHNVYPPKHYGYYEDFPEWHEKDLAAMVKRDRNHPSIIMWSVGNEIDYPNDPYVHKAFNKAVGNNDNNKPAEEMQYDNNKPDAKRLTVTSAELVKIVKELDTTRPVTAALSFPEMSEEIGLTDTLDIAGFNYREYLYEASRKNHPDRVVLDSENGRGDNEWRYVRDNECIAGQFIWTGIDYLGEAAGWPVRASGAGFIDLAGFEKPSYYKRKALWSDSPFVYIAVKGEEASEAESKWDFSDGERVTVYCYTNLDSVELFINGASLGEKNLTADDFGETSWQTVFIKGEISAKAKSASGRKSGCSLKTSGKAKYAEVFEELTIDGITEYSVYIFDENGVSARGDDRDIAVEVNGGELLGIENGDIKDLTPYSEAHRKTKSGRLTFYVRHSTAEKPAVICKISEQGDVL